MAPPKQPLVEAEDGQGTVAAFERGAQRRMVMRPQVAREPDERRHLRVKPRAAKSSRTARAAAMAPKAPAAATVPGFDLEGS
jgi:hypothetical protein